MGFRNNFQIKSALSAFLFIFLVFDIDLFLSQRPQSLLEASGLILGIWYSGQEVILV